MAGDDDDAFAEAMSGVIPLGDRDRVVKKPNAGKKPTKVGRLAFHVDGDEGRAYGVNNAQLAKLRSGGFAVDHTVDLHRCKADVARQLVSRRIADTAASGGRCVLVIHGRGLHSGGVPVLRSVVVAALTKGASARHVLAFCPALPKHGGDGAMYVLLRAR